MPSPSVKPAKTKLQRMQQMLQITNMRYSTLFMLWSGLAFAFGIAYFLIASIDGGHGPVFFDGTISLGDIPTASRFLNSLYFSIITATSTGYGDIVPLGFSKVLASIQSISALFIFAMFVTKLVSHRQEMALQEVHRMTFEDIFHNTREDLYIVRKDFDNIMAEAQERKALSDDCWENLTTAYRQAQSLISGIPEFYDGGNTLYIIDSKREELLLEAVHRTIHRINTMLDTLSALGIDWVAHQQSVAELSELSRVIKEVTPIWRQRSPHEHMREAFEDILLLTDSVHARITKALPV